jgi:transposase
VFTHRAATGPALSDWLAEVEITHVAMESTGEYWKPVFNLLEGTCQVFLVNAAHMKLVPSCWRS